MEDVQGTRDGLFSITYISNNQYIFWVYLECKYSFRCLWKTPFLDPLILMEEAGKRAPEEFIGDFPSEGFSGQIEGATLK